MGKKRLKQAEELGFLEFPLTVLYGRAKKMRMGASNTPDYHAIFKDFMKVRDPDYLHGDSGGPARNSYYYLSEKLQAFIHVFSRRSGFSGWNAANFPSEIKIYTHDMEFVRGVAVHLNSVWSDGIMPHMQWDKLKSKFGVSKEDVIAEWSNWIDIEASAKSAAERAAANRFACPNCQASYSVSTIKNITPGKVECPKCAKWIDLSIKKYKELKKKEEESS
jgi:hypothetical protein